MTNNRVTFALGWKVSSSLGFHYNHVEIVNLLLFSGADVNCIDRVRIFMHRNWATDYQKCCFVRVSMAVLHFMRPLLMDT